jgi:hypothetical protein
MTTTENQQQTGTGMEQTTQSQTGSEQQSQGSTQATQQATTSDSASTDLGTDQQEGTDLGSEGSSEEAKPPVPEFFGAPEGEATYEGFKLPEGSTADPELQTSFSALAKSLGLNQAGAQKLVDYKATLDQQQVKAWGNHLNELRSASRADPEIGGAKYDESVKLGQGVIKKFGTPGLRDVMNKYGVGAHPEMIRFMAKIGRAVGETPTGGGEGSGGSVEQPLHELFYGDSSRSKQGT